MIQANIITYCLHNYVIIYVFIIQIIFENKLYSLQSNHILGLGCLTDLYLELKNMLFFCVAFVSGIL